MKVGAEGTEGEPAASVWTSTTDKEPPSGPDASAPLMLTLGDILVAGGVEGGAGLRRDEGSQTAPVRRRSLRRPERFGHDRSGGS